MTDAKTASNWWMFKIGTLCAFALACGINYHLFGQELIWPFRMALLLLCGLFASVWLLLIPKPILARIGQLPLLSENWITFWGLVLFWAGVPIFLAGHHAEGLGLSGIGGVMDVLDGKMAVAKKEAGIYRSPASRRLGKWFDPLGDKLKYLPMIILFTLAGLIPLWVTIGIICFAVFGTLIRNPINIGARMAYTASKMRRDSGLVRALYWLGSRLVRKSKASAFGKLKATLEALGLVVCIPYFLKWCDESLPIPEVVYQAALVLGALSILSRMRLGRTIDRLIDKVGETDLFKHKDITLGRLA